MKIATFNVNAFAARLPALSAQRASRAREQVRLNSAGWSAGVKKSVGVFAARLTVICDTAADQTDMVWSHQRAVIQQCRNAQDCQEDRFRSALHATRIRRADALKLVSAL